MSKPLQGLPDLRAHLEVTGWRIGYADRGESNECNWQAWRPSKLPARRCECNETRPGVQIVLQPFQSTFPNCVAYASVEVEVRGEAAGKWWILKCYSVDPKDLPDQLAEIEARLVDAWNALVPDTEAGFDINPY